LGYTLRPYQKHILEDLKDLDAVALYMATGTGKTVTAIEKYKQQPTHRLLVICPQSVITQWEETIRFQAPELSVMPFKKSWSAKEKDEFIRDNWRNYDVIIINFDIIHKMVYLPKIVSQTWTIIVDEMHRIRNWGTTRNRVKVTKAVVELGPKTPYKIGLTATPTQGNYGGYIDYYPQLLFLGYTKLDFKTFCDQHIIYKDEFYPTSPYPIKKIIRYVNIDKIENTLKSMARRYVPNYLDFTPQHNEIFVDKTKSYSKVLREFAYKDITLNNTMRKRIALKTLTTGSIYGQDLVNNHYTYEDNTHKLEWLEDFLTDTDEIVSIFYQYNVELDSLVKLLNKLGKRTIIINGKTKDKYLEIKRDDYDVIIGQFQAMSEGLDGMHLKTHISIFFSMPESSLLYKQAIGRIDRIGQTKVPMYYYLIMKDTIDEVIMKLIKEKVEFSEQTLEQLEIGGV
jgi:superfamily II DNA or RNA helicase